MKILKKCSYAAHEYLTTREWRQETIFRGKWVNRPADDPHVVVGIFRGRSKTSTCSFKYRPFEWKNILRESNSKKAVKLGGLYRGGDEYFYYYLYKDIVYESEIDLPTEDVALIADQEVESKEARIFREVERVKAKAELDGATRVPIPEDVQVTVWNRDSGKCVNCGSNESLEFDHIIPVSKGGSNTARNIQLLCENCNRKKGANIGG